MPPRLRAWARSLIALRYQSEVQPLNRLFEADKRHYLTELVRRHDEINVFVETGTYLGKTAQQLAKVCDQVVTIEIDRALYERASDLFANDTRVQVLHGDSANLLSQVLDGLDSPALFWLDGHFSGGITGGSKQAPILYELRAIIAHPVKDHIVVVDDARLFRGRGGYPRLTDLVALLHGSGYDLIVQSGLIRIQRQDFTPEA